MQKMPWSLILCVFLSGCAFVHKVQVGEIDSRVVNNGERFELLVSETGVNVIETAATASIFVEQGKKKAVGSIAAIVSLFQMGPRTGNIAFSDSYADSILEGVWSKCPGGRISGVMAVRESNRYPIVSGEIVKITGYCSQRTASTEGSAERSPTAENKKTKETVQ